MLTRTCKKFFVFVNKIQRFQKADRHMKDVFNIPMEYSFFSHFPSDFKIFFHNHFPGYANKLYLKWFMSHLKDYLNERLLFAHVYWCRRNTNDPYGCKICLPVYRCKIMDSTEPNTQAVFSLISYGRWDEEFVKIFENEDYYSTQINKSFKSCPPRDFVHCYNQLLNYFAKIGVRIFLNLGKRYFFFSKFEQKFFYDGYLEQTRYLFSSITSNVRKSYIKSAVEYLVPVRDYDSTYFIVSNNYYIQYLKKRKQKCRCERS